jgi:hypothetical protein
VRRIRLRKLACTRYRNTTKFPKFCFIEQVQRVLGWQPAAAVDTQLATLEQALAGTSLPLEDAVPVLAARRSARQGGRSRRWNRW